MAPRLVIALLVLLTLPADALAGWRDEPDPSAKPETPAITTTERVGPATVVRTWYRTWRGIRRELVVAYPAGGTRPLPLLVTARPAGMSLFCAEEANVALAARAGFAVACPSGQGVWTRSFSYAAPGQIDDLARMPEIVAERVPGLRVDADRRHLAGSSMGGTEALAVALRHPGAYTAVAALDPIVDLGRRFPALPRMRRLMLQAECDGPPVLRPACFRRRSPLAHVDRGPGTTRVVLWYSRRDPVAGHADQGPRFADALAGRRPPAFDVRVGGWGHSALWERPAYRPTWLRDLGLLDSPVAGDEPAAERWQAREGRLVRR